MKTQKRNPKNPFYQIRMHELYCTVDRIPGVSRATVYALEKGVRKIITYRVLAAYIRVSQQYTDPEKLLHEYQQVYQYPETPLQDYQGRALNPKGYCNDCGEYRSITQYGLYAAAHICSECRIKRYNISPEIKKKRIEYYRKARGHIGYCITCGRSTSIQCIRCDQIVCVAHARSTGVRESNGTILRVCLACLEMFNNS